MGYIVVPIFGKNNATYKQGATDIRKIKKATDPHAEKCILKVATDERLNKTTAAVRKDYDKQRDV